MNIITSATIKKKNATLSALTSAQAALDIRLYNVTNSLKGQCIIDSG